MKRYPPVAPYRTVLPTNVASAPWNVAPGGKPMEISPPPMPLATQRLNDVSRGGIAWDPSFLAPVGNRDFVARILRNLKGIYLNGADHGRTIRMMDLLVALLPSEARERRDRGLLHFELEHWEQAKEDLRSYLDSGSPSQDTAAVNWMLERIDANHPR